MTEIPGEGDRMRAEVERARKVDAATIEALRVEHGLSSTRAAELGVEASRLEADAQAAEAAGQRHVAAMLRRRKANAIGRASVHEAKSRAEERHRLNGTWEGWIR